MEDEISPETSGGRDGEASSEQGGVTLAFLSDILLKDEQDDFEVPGAVAGEFLDIKSFLEEPAENDLDGGDGFQVEDCSKKLVEGEEKAVDDFSRKRKRAENDVDGGEGFQVDACASTERPAGGGEEEKAVDDFCRKRKRESAVKSRERKKKYERFLESKCRMLENKCRSLEQSVTYSSLENAVLKQELSRMKAKDEEASRAEPAVLFADSLQEESLLCSLMTWLMLMVLLVRSLPPLPAPLRAVVMLVIVKRRGEYGRRYRMPGSRREWKWSRKKPK